MPAETSKLKCDLGEVCRKEAVMLRKSNSKRLLFVICAVAVAAFAVGIVGCAPKANPGNPTRQATKAEVTPEPDKFGVVEADQ